MGIVFGFTESLPNKKPNFIGAKIRFTENNEEYTKLELEIVRKLIKKRENISITEIYNTFKGRGSKRSYGDLALLIYNNREFMYYYKDTIKYYSKLSDININKYYKMDVIRYAQEHGLDKAIEFYDISNEQLQNWIIRYDGTIDSLDFKLDEEREKEKEKSIVKHIIEKYSKLTLDDKFQIAKDLGYFSSIETFEEALNVLKGI